MKRKKNGFFRLWMLAKKKDENENGSFGAGDWM